MPETRAAQQPTAEERLWLALAAIPCGQVTSYGRLAALAGLPGRARWVGRQLSQLPQGSRLPWYRVMGASGKLSFPPESSAFERQRARLQEEGVAISDGGRLLSRRFWPDE